MAVPSLQIMADSPLVRLLIKGFGMTVGLMAVIMIACIATPHLARLIDRILKKQPPADDAEKDNDGDESDKIPEVRGAYDASHDEEYDLNYKIYNKDIYGVDFKDGKKGKR